MTEKPAFQLQGLSLGSKVLPVLLARSLTSLTLDLPVSSLGPNPTETYWNLNPTGTRASYLTHAQLNTKIVSSR